MMTLRDMDLLEPGDVIASPEGALAQVDRIEVGGVRLTAPAVADGPSLIDAATLVQGWKLGVPGGFFCRALLDTEGLRLLAQQHPIGLLRLILDELEQPVSLEELQAQVVGRRIVGRSPFPRWWEGVVQQLGRSDHLAWDGHRLSWRADNPSMPGDPEVFLALAPGPRFRTWLSASHRARATLLDVAVEAGDLSAVHLLLRGRATVPDEHVAVLHAAALEGDAALCGALLTRACAPTVQACAAMSAEPGRRPWLREVLLGLPPSRRQSAGLGLLEQVLQESPAEHIGSQGGPTEEGAARFLTGLLPLSPTQTLEQLRLDPGVATARSLWPRTLPFLEAEARNIGPGFVPLQGLGRLVAARLLSVSIGLARALAERHALDLAGGVAEARLGPTDRVELGPASEGDPLSDVMAAARLVVERAVGQLPRNGKVREDDLVVHLPQLVPDAPPEWAAVMARCLSPEGGLRPRNGLDLWEQLAQAAAIAEVRKQAPLRRGARLRVAHDTHIGALKSRLGQTNQDAVFWQADGSLAFLVVADGISVSTAGSGDLASSLLVRTLIARWEAAQASLREADDAQVEAFLVSSLAEANHAICKAALELAGGNLGRHIPMGTTALVAVVQGDRVNLASLGDSRAYLVGAIGASQLNGDQNLRSEWLRTWQKGNRMDLHNEGYALVGYCGHFGENGQSEPVLPDLRRFRLLPGEVLCLCSDGLTDYASGSPAEASLLIEEAARMSDLGEACRSLVGRANAGGGGDNITVILARQEEG